MAAGLGFKTFTSGEVLTAADTNGYLMQGILVFASASTRNAAITSPQEGQYCYLKDTNSTEYYDGAAWVSGVEGDISGVTAGTGITGGGTSGTVTVTNSMATAIDAKGDLVPGTGADTFARLAVGTNFGFLQADSAQATGLLWNNAAWTAYTPTVTASSGTFTTVAGTGLYTRVGKLCVTATRVTITTNGTAAGQIVVTSPFTAATGSFNYVGSVKETAVTANAGVATIVGAGTAFRLTKYDSTYIGGTGYVLDTTISYEVA